MVDFTVKSRLCFSIFEREERAHQFWIRRAQSADRLRDAPSVCRVAGGCDDVMLHWWIDGRSLSSP